MLPNSSCCYCTPDKAVIQLGLTFVKVGYSGYGSDDYYGINKPTVSPYFPEHSEHQWYIKFDPKAPEICSVIKSPSSKTDFPSTYFRLRVGPEALVEFNFPAGSQTEYRAKLPICYYSATTGSTNNLTVNVILTISLEGKKAPLLPLANDFKVLLDNKIGSDVSIVSNNGQLAAHRAVLSARSPVFSAMLTNDFKENRVNEIKLAHLNKETVEKMLEFIYTDKVEIGDVEEGQALLRAGDEYLVEGLKKFAEHVLCEFVKEENATDLFILGHLHKAYLLKQEALKMLWLHPNCATENKPYSDLLKHPELVKELIAFRGSQ